MRPPYPRIAASRPMPAPGRRPRGARCATSCCCACRSAAPPAEPEPRQRHRHLIPAHHISAHTHGIYARRHALLMHVPPCTIHRYLLVFLLCQLPALVMAAWLAARPAVPVWLQALRAVRRASPAAARPHTLTPWHLRPPSHTRPSCPQCTQPLSGFLNALVYWRHLQPGQPASQLAQPGQPGQPRPTRAPPPRPAAPRPSRRARTRPLAVLVHVLSPCSYTSSRCALAAGGSLLPSVAFLWEPIAFAAAATRHAVHRI